VAEQAIRAGASIINDVSGLRFDPHLAEVARRHRTLLVLMHLRGRPASMQRKPFARSVWRSIKGGLQRSVRHARDRGVPLSKLIIDPGLGFGKSRRQNFEILAHLGCLNRFHLPILVGTSRKSFVQGVLDSAGTGPSRGNPGSFSALAARSSGAPSRPLQKLLAGDAAAVAASILAGAHIVRVHDVEAILPAVRIADAILAETA
jgi:dihydropteroate synthase